MTKRDLNSVMSSANTDFDSQYEKLKEIGRGGFSTVFQCRHKQSGDLYAVKVTCPLGTIYFCKFLCLLAFDHFR